MTRWPSRSGSIRFRITAMATLVVAIVLGAAALALIALQRQQLFANLDASLAQRADNYEESFLEDPEEQLSVFLNTSDEDRAVQLVDSDGRVLASTPNLSGVASLDNPVSVDRRQRIRSTNIPEIEDDSYRILTRMVETESGPAVFHIAQNIDDLNDVMRALTFSLGLAVPIVVGILAVLVWWLIGRTLRPVELIRAEVADISGTDLHRRVPVPEQEDEIERLATTMNEMLDRIDSAGRRQRQFVADASHELRSPLTRIRTEIEVDINQPDRADRFVTHKAVLDETVGLQKLLEDLLFLARSDEDQSHRPSQPTDLDDIVLEEVQTIRSDASRPDANGGDDGDSQPAVIDISNVSAAHLDGDPNQLRRLVKNLVSNALRHAETTVFITLGERGDMVRLTVADDGPGVPTQARDRIFERFGRADGARAGSDRGVGLGLAIVSDIVERHGGTINYDDSQSKGACFVVDLPRGNPDQPVR